MKPEEIRMNQHTRIDDTRFRLVLIPAFGIIIPLLTGMMHFSGMHPYMMASAFLYTIMIAFVIWQGNRYFLFTLRDYFDWFNNPVKRIIALLIAICFYTVPVSIVLHIGWYHLFHDGLVEWNTIYLSTLIILICVIFISHTYETVFLVKESENERIKSEQLQRAKTEAELQALNSQIDPHFLFNSLNTLSHLIEEAPGKALEFNDNLADVYRYILQNKSVDLVALSGEMEFAEKYFALLKKRFESAIVLVNEVDSKAARDSFLPPISVQILIENVVKHNRMSESSPLTIHIKHEPGRISVSNNLQLRNAGFIKPGTGLSNLENRYRLIMNKSIAVENDEQNFKVSLPIISSRS